MFWLCDPLDYRPPGSSVHEILPSKNTEVGFDFLLQGVFLTQRSNPHLYVSYIGRVGPWPLVPPSYQFSSVTQSCLTLCDPMDCSMPGLPVHQQLPEFTQTHIHWVGGAIQPAHPLSSPSPPPAPNLSQHQGLFQWVSSSHQVAKVLEFQLQHQSFQWIFRTDFL